MMAALHGAEFFCLAMVAALALCSVATASLVAIFGVSLRGWAPRTRHRALLFIAALPVLAAGALLLSATLPGLISLIVPAWDHCSLHNDGHPHLCLRHLPAMGMNHIFVALLAAVIGYSLLRATSACFRIHRAIRIVRTLARSGDPLDSADVTIIDSKAALCVSAGLFAPKIIISRHLFESLRLDEREIMLAHERAHVARRDALVATIVRILSSVHLPATARWLNSELEVAAEQACDEVAAIRTGDRLAVAETILTVERAIRVAQPHHLGAVVVGFAPQATARRVEALLNDKIESGSLQPLAIGLGIFMLVALATSPELHHNFESILATIAY